MREFRGSVSLAGLFVALFSAMLGVGIIAPILPFYAQSLGASRLMIGFIFAAFPLARITLMPLLGGLSDQKGRKPFIVLGLALVVPVSLGYILAGDPEKLFLVRLCHGAAAAMIVPIVQAYVGEMSPEKKEGRYMGGLAVAMLMGFGLGPMMGGVLLEHWGYSSIFYALGSLSFLACLLIGFSVPESPNRVATQGGVLSGFRRMLRERNIRGLFSMRLANATCNGAMLAFLPVLASEQMHLGSTQIGLLLSSNLLLTGVLQVPFGLLADRVDRKRIALVGGVGFAAVLFLIPLAESFAQIFALSLVYGVAVALTVPTTMALMATEGKQFGMGSAMSLFNMAMSLGIGTGPILAGWVADTFGLVHVFRVISVVALAGVGVFWFSYRSPATEGEGG